MYRFNMVTELLVLSLICSFNTAKSEIIPKVVGGSIADIRQYPHSAFLYCSDESISFICGASILNQRILLTAAHCIDKPRREAYAFTGHADNTLGTKHQLAAVKPHESYHDHSIGGDIGLILVKYPIRFNKFVQRVSITRFPPMVNRAAVAGWGLISENPYKDSHLLHHCELDVWTHDICRRYIGGLPRDCLCAGSLRGKTYAARGDSGSALVVNGYIQIGVVSYKTSSLISLVAFTNVSYHYHWINNNAKLLYCKYG